jgi:hypothetical protein
MYIPVAHPMMPMVQALVKHVEQLVVLNTTQKFKNLCDSGVGQWECALNGAAHQAMLQDLMCGLKWRDVLIGSSSLMNTGG